MNTCEYCGRELPVVETYPDDDQVAWISDPFDSDINNDDTEHWLCGRCAGDRAMEI